MDKHSLKEVFLKASDRIIALTGHTLSKPTSERREYLRHCYGFDCACAACSADDNAKVSPSGRPSEGDRLRRRVADNADKIERLVYHNEEEEEVTLTAEKAEADLREALEVAEQQLRLMTSLGFKVLNYQRFKGKKKVNLVPFPPFRS